MRAVFFLPALKATTHIGDINMSENKIINLPSGKTAEILPFKGYHIRAAQRKMGEDTSLFIFALISECVNIDGKPVIIEELDQMDGRDVIKLQAEFSGANF